MAADPAARPTSISVAQRSPVAKAGAALAVAPSVAGAVADVLSGLGNLLGLTPGSGGFADVVLAGLDVLRRQIQNLIFRTSPAAVPEQWAQTPKNLVLGTVGATDAEGNPLTYAVLQAPQYGTVELGSDGTYVYTPQTAFIRTGGTDTFTVGVTEAGLPNDFGVLSFFARTTPVTVAVTVTPSRPLLSVGAGATYTTGFDVYNLSSQTMVYAGEPLGEDPVDSGPPVGKTYQPGDYAHFEVPRYFMTGVWSSQRFDLVDAAGEVTQYRDVVFSTNGWSGDTGASCDVGGTATCESVGNAVMILDPVGTTINLSSSDRAQQEAALKLCDSAATCTFTAKQLVQGSLRVERRPFATLRNPSTVYTQAGVVIDNPGRTTTQTTETSLSVSKSVELSIYGVVNAAIAEETGQSWSDSESYTNAFFLNVYPVPDKLTSDVTLPDGTVLPAGTVLPEGTFREGQMLLLEPVNRVYTDAVVKLGNTTWNLSDIYVDYPDATRQAAWSPSLELVLGGDPDGTNVTLTLPNGLFSQDTTLVLPRGTRISGYDTPPT